MIEMKRVLAVLVAVLICVFSAVPAFAAKKAKPSPTPSKEYNLIIHPTKGGTGTYTSKTDDDGKHCYIVAHPKKGYKFIKWVIKGKYDLEEGDLNSEKLTIVLRSDCEATPYFEKEGSKSSSSSTPASSNPSSESPKTGGNILFFIIALAAAFMLITAALGVKLARSKK